MLPGSRPSFIASNSPWSAALSKFRPYHLSSMFAWRRHAATIADCLPRPDTEKEDLTWSLLAYRRNLAHPSLRLSTCARTLLTLLTLLLILPRISAFAQVREREREAMAPCFIDVCPMLDAPLQSSRSLVRRVRA